MEGESVFGKLRNALSKSCRRTVTAPSASSEMSCLSTRHAPINQSSCSRELLELCPQGAEGSGGEH